MNKNSLFFLFLGFLFLVLTQCSNISTETENNDSLFFANPITINQKMQGYLNYEGDKDAFIITTTQTSNAFIDVVLESPSNIDMRMVIYKNNDIIKKINSYDVRGDIETFSSFFINNKDKFYIVVSSVNDDFDQKHPYFLLIREKKQRNLEKEPNDKITEATRIEPGTTIVGFFSPSKNPLNIPLLKEDDWYKIEILQDNLVMRLDVTSVPNVDFSVGVYDKTGFLIRYVDDNSTNDSESLVNIGLHQKGWYYIQIENKNFMENTKTPYKIISDIKKYEPNTEFENNNSFFNANSIPIGELVTGYINPNNDVDMYKIEISGNKRYILNINLSPISDIDFVLNVYNKNFVLIQKIDNYGPDNPETIPNLGINDSPTYIKISSKTSGNSEKPYTLTTKLKLWQQGEEFEQNNAKPTICTPNSLIKGFFSSTNDMDSYFVKVTASGNYSLKLNYIYNNAVGYKIFKSNKKQKLYNSLFSGNFKEKQIMTLKKGYYIIQLTSTKFNLKSPYAFILTKL